MFILRGGWILSAADILTRGLLQSLHLFSVCRAVHSHLSWAASANGAAFRERTGLLVLS